MTGFELFFKAFYVVFGVVLGIGCGVIALYWIVRALRVLNRWVSRRTT